MRKPVKSAADDACPLPEAPQETPSGLRGSRRSAAWNQAMARMAQANKPDRERG